MRKAANCFKRAIEINPRKADAHNGLGQVYNDKKGVKADYNSAIQYYNRAIELEPKNPCYHRNKGVTYFCTKQYSAAVLCFDEAIRLNPNECELYFIKGNAHKELKQFSEAQICYKKALELKPNEDYKKKIGKSLAIVKGKLENNHSPNKNENQRHSTSDDELGINSEKIKYHNGNKRIKLT
jgi:tetratricopeptide (TPR) repeat protein